MNVLLLALNAKFIHSSLALRSIKSYCNEYSEHIQIIEATINNSENEIVKQIYKAAPDILGISCYIWNMSFIKLLIPTIKKVLPDTTLILGGPEVSYQSDELFESLNIDVIMEGEGEETWKEYLDYRFKNTIKLEVISGLVYKTESGIKRTNERVPLDLSLMRFAYEDFDELKNKIIYYEASRGCPFNCQYCLSSVQSGVRFVPIEKVKMHLQIFLDEQVKQVKFVDRTFNAHKSFALEIWRYLMLHDNGRSNFHFEIAAELLDDEMIHTLKEARPGLFQFEIGVQSTNRDVLHTINRKMPFKDISQIVRKIKETGNIHQHLDLIAGLPFEDYASFKKSFDDVIALRPEQFQLGFLKVLKGSGLRKNAALYGLIYKEEPPYEILFTNALSYDNMLQLHSIEEMVERYYNSRRFQSILEYLFTVFNSTFDFFEKLALFWEEQHYDRIQHNKLSYYVKLAEFCRLLPEVNAEFCIELIRFDYYKYDHLTELPASLQTLNKAVFKASDNELLKDDSFIETAAPHLLNMPLRQRYRMTHIEHFKYHIYHACVHQNFKTMSQHEAPCSILFDYSHTDTRCILLD